MADAATEGLEGSGMNQSTVSTMSSPILSPSAIANIICGFLAVVVITVALCYLTRSFNEDQRKTRVKTSLENNKRIDQQITAAKARAQHRIEQTMPQSSGELCSDSLNVAEIGIQYRPLTSQDPHPQHDTNGETLDGSPSGSQMSTRVNREVAALSARTT